MLDRLAEIAPGQFTVAIYNGDTLENFRTRAYVSRWGVIFNKRRTPGVGDQTVNYFEVGGMYTPFIEAIKKASDLMHTPLIMRSYLFRNSRYTGKPPYDGYVYIPADKNILVNCVWIPRRPLDYSNVYHELTSGNTSIDEVFALFISCSPQDVLK